MRKRSMSVFVPRDDNRLSRKFEGVVSDHEAQSDSENEDLETEIHLEETKVPVEVELSEGWSKQEYETLVAQMRDSLPKKDVKKWKTSLQTVDWSQISVGQRPTTEVERVAKELIGKIRSFRTLSEMLDEVPEVVNKLLVAHRPKPPITAYSLFVKEKLPQLREEHKDLKVQQIFKLIPEQYKALSAKKRRRFEADAARLKEEYHQQLQKFYDEHPELSPKKGYKPKKEPLKTPFHLFFLERHEISKNITPQQARKEWELLPVKDKVPFIQRSFDEQGATDSKLVNKKELDMLEKNLGKPEFCGRSPLDYYRKKMKTAPGKEQEEKIRAEYKNLSKEEMEALKQEYLKARATFVDEYRKYIKKLPKDKQQAEIDFLKTISEKKSTKVKSENANAPAEDDGYLEEPPAAESTTINKKPPTKTTNKAVAAIKKEHKSDHSSDADSVDHPTPKKKSSKKAAATTPAAAPVASPTKRKQQSSSSNNVTTKTEQSASEESSDDFEEKEERAPPKRTKAAAPPASPTKNGKKRPSDGELQPPAAAKKTKVKKEDEQPASATKVTPKEPEKPPKDAEEFYRQRIYKGKVGRHKESYANLSSAKKRDIVEQLKAAQKQYIIDFEVFLKSLPKEEIRRYIQQKATAQKKAEKSEDSDDDDDDDEDDDEEGSSEEDED